jgi:hypothetical protein
VVAIRVNVLQFLSRRGLSGTDFVFFALAAVSMLPVLLARYPLCADCLNHMARLFVLTAPDGAPIHHFYTVHWRLSANLGFEIVALPLAAVLPLEIVMKAVWALCVAGLAGAVWFFHRGLFARTQDPLLLAAAAFYNLPLTSGFLGFMLGVTLALFAAGLWLRWRTRITPGRLVAFNLLAGLTLLFHIAAAAALALTVLALHGTSGRRFDIRRSAVAAAGFVVPAMLFAVMALLHPTMSGADSGTVSFVALSKLSLPVAPTFSGNAAADIVGALLLWGGALAVWRFGGRLHPLLAVPLVVWLVTVLALPNQIGNASGISQRLALLPALLLVASLQFPHDRAKILTAAVCVSVAARIGLVLPDWRSHDSEIAGFRAMTLGVSPGAKLLTVSVPEQPHCLRHRWQPFDEHVPTLLAMDRAAFVSTIFADPNMQTIEPAAAVRGLASPNAGIIPWELLAAGDANEAGNVRAQPAAIRRFYPRGWRRHYDYLVLVDTSCAIAMPSSAGLTPVGASAPFRLYRIGR